MTAVACTSPRSAGNGREKEAAGWTYFNKSRPCDEIWMAAGEMDDAPSTGSPSRPVARAFLGGERGGYLGGKLDLYDMGTLFIQ